MNRLPSFKAALMHESELVNCETTHRSESGLEAADGGGGVRACVHTRTPIGILFETIFCGSPRRLWWGLGVEVGRGGVMGGRHAPAQTGDGHNC